MNNTKQERFIEYLTNKINDSNWKIKAEYSTNDNDSKVITVQETAGQKEVFYDNDEPLYNYFMIDIYGLTIQESKKMAVFFSNLIGKSEKLEINDELWQFIILQFVNPQAIQYMDIRRVGYNATFQVVVNRVR